MLDPFYILVIQTDIMSTNNGGVQLIADWYGLKYSYRFDPVREREHRLFMAPRMITENESLESHLSKFQGDLMADLTPKRIYSGDPGNGKTHLLLHVSEKLASHNFEFKHVECPALGKSVKPFVLFTELLNRLGGKNAVIDLIIDAYKKCRKDAINEQPEQYADESEKTLSPYLDKVFLGNTDLTDLTKAAVDNDETKRRNLWLWLTGGKGDPSITAVNLKDDGAALVRIFKALFSIYEKSTGKKLLVIFDELDKGKILGPEASEAWNELFRQICDASQKNAGILMAITPETLNSKAVIDESVKSRVGDGNLIELTKMSDSGDIENFVKEIVAWNRKDGLDVEEKINEFKSELNGEDVTVSSYPFTTAAINEIGNTYSESVPRVILDGLSRACAFAQQNGKHFVTAEEISKLKSDDLAEVADT